MEFLQVGKGIKNIMEKSKDLGFISHNIRYAHSDPISTLVNCLMQGEFTYIVVDASSLLYLFENLNNVGGKNGGPKKAIELINAFIVMLLTECKKYNKFVLFTFDNFGRDAKFKSKLKFKSNIKTIQAKTFPFDDKVSDQDTINWDASKEAIRHTLFSVVTTHVISDTSYGTGDAKIFTLIFDGVAVRRRTETDLHVKVITVDNDAIINCAIRKANVTLQIMRINGFNNIVNLEEIHYSISNQFHSLCIVKMLLSETTDAGLGIKSDIESSIELSAKLNIFKDSNTFHLNVICKFIAIISELSVGWGLSHDDIVTLFMSVSDQSEELRAFMEGTVAKVTQEENYFMSINELCQEDIDNFIVMLQSKSVNILNNYVNKCLVYLINLEEMFKEFDSKLPPSKIVEKSIRKWGFTFKIVPSEINKILLWNNDEVQVSKPLKTIKFVPWAFGK